jgi:hypothetical protein
MKAALLPRESLARDQSHALKPMSRQNGSKSPRSSLKNDRGRAGSSSAGVAGCSSIGDEAGASGSAAGAFGGVAGVSLGVSIHFPCSQMRAGRTMGARDARHHRENQGTNCLELKGTWAPTSAMGNTPFPKPTTSSSDLFVYFFFLNQLFRASTD